MIACGKMPSENVTVIVVRSCRLSSPIRIYSIYLHPSLLFSLGIPYSKIEWNNLFDSLCRFYSVNVWPEIFQPTKIWWCGAAVIHFSLYKTRKFPVFSCGLKKKRFIFNRISFTATKSHCYLHSIAQPKSFTTNKEFQYCAVDTQPCGGNDDIWKMYLIAPWHGRLNISV